MPSVHPTAVVDPSAILGDHVEVGPLVVVEAHACIGDRTRLLASSLVASGCTIGADCVIHPGAVVGGPPQVRDLGPVIGGLTVGARTVIREHVTIHRATDPASATIIGADVLLMAGCHIGHSCRVGDGAIVACGALIAGHVVLGEGTFVSGNAAIHQFVTVGRLGMISGLSRVVKDVLPFAVVAGSSKVRGLNIVGMRRNGMTATERQNVRRAFGVLYRSGLNVSQAVARLRAMPRNHEVDEWLAFIERSRRGLCAGRQRRELLRAGSK